MAKGNMFQGMARGKVGDVIFSRLNGQQISRVRNRNPHNPKSNAQLIQRAIMATVMAAYSAGKEIFDHSFQGYAKGSGCQRKFLQENAKALRSLLANEFNNQSAAEEALAKVTAPGIQVPVPNQYVVAKGTYDQELFTIDGDDCSMPTPISEETLSNYYERNGLVVGDIYTFIFIVTDKNNTLFNALGVESVSFDQLKGASFGYVRLIVKTPAGDAPLSPSATYNDVFVIETGGIGKINFQSFYLDGSVNINNLFTDYVDGSGYAWGVIRSRLDEDLRSNTTLVVRNPAEFGIVYSSLLAAWKKGAESIGNSDLILEGGDA